MKHLRSPGIFISALAVLSPCLVKAQVASYSVKTSDVASVTLEDGWLIGKNGGGKAIVTYPVKFKSHNATGHSVEKHGDAAVWKVGNVALVWTPGDFPNDANGGAYGLVVVPLAIPQGAIAWSEAECEEWDVESFTSAIGKEIVEKANPNQYKSFFGKDNLREKLQKETSDVNRRDEAEIARLTLKYNEEKRSFFNKTLERINVSLYDHLGFQRIRVPLQIVALDAEFEKGEPVPIGERRKTLMLLNKYLIDKVGRRSDSPSLFPANTHKVVDKARWWNCEVFSSSQFPINPCLASVFGNSQREEFKSISVRQLTPEEIAWFKETKVMGGVFALEGTSDPGLRDTVPRLYVKCGSTAAILNAAGCIVSYLHPSGADPRKIEFFNQWKPESRLVMRNCEAENGSRDKALLSDFRIATCELTVVTGGECELKMEGTTAVDGRTVRFTNERPPEPGRPPYRSTRVSIDNKSGTLKFEVELWEVKRYERKGRTVGDVQRYFVVQNGMNYGNGHQRRLILAGTVSDGKLLVSVDEVPLDSVVLLDKTSRNSTLGVVELGWAK